ncbi:MAG: hypothetical protein JSV58_07130 [Candidatus Bathyarchaeota archaeon]|nr:MAG: hypothetical protein JSV58_07130 [Candidatus Bathyarchaeota archaeon]
MMLQDLSLWLAVIAIILLVTSQLLSPFYGVMGLPVNKRKLRNTAIAVASLFLVTVLLRIVQILA